MNCHACGAALSPGARFCHKCGANTNPTTSASSGWKAGLPWGIAGLAVGALLVVVLMRGGGPAATGGPPIGAAPSAGGGASALDISQMSPEERAQRLFDRVMRLQEEGKQDSVQFFLPMAIGTYQQLPAMTLDSHFDIGLLQLVGGDTAAALSEADTIRQQAPTHLFIFVLRARVAQARNDTRAMTQAYKDFLKNETAERARKRPEYAEHARILDGFHAEATSRSGS
ncbi:MAG TPA: zinc-ribbon domain-containing protein [Gemmatimonadales bacterium]